MQSLIIVGAGSVGGHIAYNFDDYAPGYELLGFVDDNPDKIGKLNFGYNVIGPINLLLSVKNVAVVIGIAFPGIKRKLIERLRLNETLTFPTLISPNAWISKGSTIGAGSIIYPGVSINYGCSVGDFVIMNMNCAIGHDCIVSSYSSLAPGVNFGGHTSIGEGVDVGIGVSTRQNIKIGNYSVLGGQSMIVDNVPENMKVKGVPASFF